MVISIMVMKFNNLDIFIKFCELLQLSSAAARRMEVLNVVYTFLWYTWNLQRKY